MMVMYVIIMTDVGDYHVWGGFKTSIKFMVY